MIPFLLAATTSDGKWKTGVVSGGVLSGTQSVNAYYTGFEHYQKVSFSHDASRILMNS